MSLPHAPLVSLSARQARRLALQAALLASPRPQRRGRSAFGRIVARLSMLQMDSVSVLARAHFMPAFSRLGAYDIGMLEKAAYGRRRQLFEYWGHEASLIRLDLQPSLRWRMARARSGVGIYAGLVRFAEARSGFIGDVMREVEQRGPLTARDLAEGGRSSGSGWWGWSEGKRALEWLFWAGLVTTHSRRGFERVYDVTERVLPVAALLPTPAEDEGQRNLLLAAARALGVATMGDLRAYWRIGPQDAAARVAELVEAGSLIRARVEGWKQPAFLARELDAPRRAAAAGLVSPFDPLLWERDRAERLFGFRYRIEIYTPAHKREHGYYVLPFLLQDGIAARLDLKAERSRSRLIVKAAHLEPGARADTAFRLAVELREVGNWLRLESIEVEPRGDLAPALTAEVARLA